MSKTGINTDPRTRIADAFNTFMSGKDKSDNAEQAAIAAAVERARLKREQHADKAGSTAP